VAAWHESIVSIDFIARVAGVDDEDWLVAVLRSGATGLAAN
jgi:hypothetical protein